MKFFNKLTDVKKYAAIVVIMAVGLMVLLIGPLDAFAHGFYCEVIEPSNINEEDYLEQIDLSEGYTDYFIVENEHFRGFALYWDNLTEGETGYIRLTVMNENGSSLGSVDVDISEMRAQSWHQVEMDVSLMKGSMYCYTIEAVNCTTLPCLQVVDSDYLGEEVVGDRSILINFAYAKPTFTFPEKILLSILIICIGFMILGKMILKREAYKAFSSTIYFIVMVIILSWNYMYNSFDSRNYSFENFQEESETLVTGAIYAEENNVPLDKYGLGRYITSKGVLDSNNRDFLNDEDWTHGYYNTAPQIVLSNQDVVRKVVQAGNQVMFSNGDILRIVGNYVTGDWIIVTLDAEQPLNYYKYGDLSQTRYYDENMNLLRASEFSSYTSQFGLQGKVFRHLARYFSEENILPALHLVCCMSLAIVFSLLIVLIRKKYNKLLAVCFLIVFLLSPWIVNFARNLYWVEFTWFIPMLVGLFCAYCINRPFYRLLSYIAVFVAILGKCLCGYEYISVVMMGSISFLLVDLIKAFSNKDKQQFILILKTTIIIGCMALLGFTVAICIHANVRGDGNLLEGIRSIIERDVLRRTNGGNLNELAEVYWPSLNASVWETFSIYFHFQTEIISGIAGNLFPVLCLIPIAIFAVEFRRNKLNVEEISLYCVFFITSTSWFILGKAHSYIHTVLNYVLWYFGFIQIVFYIVCKHVIDYIKNHRNVF